MSNLSKPKLGKFLATIAALSSVTAILTTANKAEAIPLYPNDFGSSTQTVRLQMERTAPNGQPVTINITRAYGLKNGGLVNTWTGNPDGESLYNYITNGYGINFQSKNGPYSISSPTVEVRDGTQLYTYASGFGRYQDWNIEKLGGQYGDTYLFRWRTDINTNLCLDIRGFAPGQSLSNVVPGLSYCDGNNANQRIRVIKQGQGQPTPAARITMPPGSNIPSNSQCFRLDAQTDGNLVLYNVVARKPIWNSGTNGRSVKSTVFQNDGDLVINDSNNNPIWRLGTNGRGATRLAVQDDGNLVMYNAQNQAVWASNTVQPCGNPTPPPPPTHSLPTSTTQANQYFKLQYSNSTYNPDGPLSSLNCGPSSVAMIVKLFGKEPPNLSVQTSINRARQLMNAPGNTLISDGQMKTGLVNAGLKVNSYQFNGNLAQIDRDLSEGKAVIAMGYYGNNWRNQFPSYSLTGSGNINHINTILGKTQNGNYLVGDPMYRGGVVEMNRNQLMVFFSYNGGLHISVSK